MVGWLKNRLGGHRESGAVVVEFALVAILLFMLIFGIVEFGRYMAFVEGVNTATREGARFGSAVNNTADCAGIRNEAKALSGVAALEDANISIDYLYEDGTPNGDCDGGPTTALIAGDQIVVTVQKQFFTPVPLISSILSARIVDSVDRRTIFIGEFGNPNP